MRPILSVTSFAAVLLAFCLSATAASAQETRGLSDRLDRLERDLNTLQSQVYRGGGGSSSSAGGGAISGDTYSMLDQRINQLEQQIRDLNAQVEKVSYATSQLQAKVDHMDKDNDLRFKELEQKAGASGAPQAGNAAPANGQPQHGGKPADWNPTMGSPPGNLGQVSQNDLKAAQAGANNAAPAKAGAPLQGKTPQEQYDYAFGLLRNSDYEGANNAFNQFVSQHPTDPLAGNAMYWLGQIPYSQGDYDKAAPLFFEAYRKYPKSAKAGESLLKVGLAFDNLNKKKEACAAVTRFISEFPDAADNLRRQATQEKSKLGC